MEIGTDLLDRDEEQRVWLFGTPDFATWYNDELPLLSADGSTEHDPLEEVEFLFRGLILRKNSSGQLARLQPTKHGVWEAKLKQTRMFGWAVEPLNLVFCAGCKIEAVKDKTGPGYQPYYDLVRNVRRQLGLKYEAGHISRILQTAS